MLHKPEFDERFERTAREIFKLIAWEQIRLSAAARFLIKNLIPTVGLIVVYGAPKCGKTFWVFDLVMHIALGWTYRGRRTKQGLVVYCLFEGQANFAARAEAFRQRHLAEHAENVPFLLMPVKLKLVEDHKLLISEIRRQIGTERPSVVVVDTLNRSYTGSESNDADMTAYVGAGDAIREAFECALIIVHHCGLEAGRPRGHTALLGAADAQIGVVKDKADNSLIATVEYMKDGSDGDKIISRLEVIEVGIDEDGEPITSCVIEPAEAQSRTTERSTLSKNQQTMLSILQAAGSHGLPVETWNERARDAGLGARKADLYDFREALLKKGLICKGANGWFAKH